MNETCQIATGFMKATLYKSSEFATSQKRRQAAEYIKKFKQTFSERYLRYDKYVAHERLKSRKKFSKNPPDDYPIRQENSNGIDLAGKIWQTLKPIKSDGTQYTNKIPSTTAEIYRT